MSNETKSKDASDNQEHMEPMEPWDLNQLVAEELYRLRTTLNLHTPTVSLNTEDFPNLTRLFQKADNPTIEYRKPLALGSKFGRRP